MEFKASKELGLMASSFKIKKEDKHFSDKDSVIKYHVDYMKRLMLERGAFNPMVIFRKDNDVMCCVDMKGDREMWGMLVRTAHSVNPDWVVFLSEAFMKKENPKKINKETLDAIYQHGDLQREFEMGYDDVDECIILTCWFGNDKPITITIEVKKKDTKVIGFGKTTKSDDFQGYVKDLGNKE
jgi:hypothetical protein